jgi:hypothetical protein
MLIRLMKEYSAAHNDDEPWSDETDLAVDLANYLPQCPTYFVTADMTAIAKGAAPSLPVSGLDVTVLPSESGFMVFDAPVAHAAFADGDMPVAAIAWEAYSNLAHDAADIPGCICPEEDIDPNCRGAGAAEGVELIPLTVHSGQLIPLGKHDWSLASPDRSDDDEAANPEEPFRPVNNAPDLDSYKPFFAAWVLMQQSITQCERTQPDRAQRKLCARLALPSDVVIVRLRRIDFPEREPSGELVPWSHRWLVGGHWRQQFYPSDKTNRPIWINPYVKGPKEKPLVVKEKVTAWVR